MHIVMFADQHVETSGGAQVSMRLQRRFLELAGHRVTIVAPRRHAQGPGTDDPAYVDLPSIPITLDREYSFTWPGRRADVFVDRAMAARPSVDVVHVQADFWGAYIGLRFAARHALPVVITMHNRVDVGIAAVSLFPGLVLRVLNAWRRRAVPGSGPGTDGWAYLRGLAHDAGAVTVPSTHFARRLERHDVFEPVDVVWNGMADELLDDALAAGRPERAAGPPTFVWVGRMSPEKRLLPFLEAVAGAGVPLRVEVIGGGGQLSAARRIVSRYGLGEVVHFAGRLPHRETLRRLGAADAAVQTSIGFETQGMTVFEAAALGTPSVVSDPEIAAELGSGTWRVGAAATADPSVSALAAALRRAAREIVAGTAPSPDPSIAERFRQSSRTAAMIEVYQRVVDSASARR